MIDKQRQAILDLEKELRSLAKGATGLADLLSGGIQSANGPVNVTDRPDRPSTPARFADLVEIDVRARSRMVEVALAAFREAFAPGPLRVVESD
jgi:hypothetical protein